MACHTAVRPIEGFDGKAPCRLARHNIYIILHLDVVTGDLRVVAEANVIPHGVRIFRTPKDISVWNTVSEMRNNEAYILKWSWSRSRVFGAKG